MKLAFVLDFFCFFSLSRKKRKNNSQNTAIDKLTEAQFAIANNDINTANSANNSAPVSNQVEQKHQRANELTLKYMNDRFYAFTSAERTDLFNMANECVIKGYYVIQARNLVDIMMNQAVIYDENCDTEANASRKTKPETTTSVSYTSFNLFPNPNNGSFSIAYTFEQNGQEFILYDLMGKEVTHATLENTEGTKQLSNGNLNAGIYFYKILNGNKTLFTGKLVINK